MTTILDTYKFAPYYTGSRKPTQHNLPFIKADELTLASGYIAPPDLISAVNVALELGLPLLLTGEPGCGKSQLAYSLAWELGLSEPFRFTVKSDTQSRDLFYHFDTLGRFRAVHTQKQNGGQVAHQDTIGSQDTDGKKPATDSDDAHRFLRMEALGSAIFHALGSERILGIDPGFSGFVDKIPKKSEHSVVLIDEIDKAPREVPNDILNEIDRMEFDIPEVMRINQNKSLFSLREARKVSSADGPLHYPIVIITSNSERELPEAFLRRCVYFHVELPPFRNALPKNSEKKTIGSNDDDNDTNRKAVTVQSIVESRLGLTDEINDETDKSHAQKSILPGGIAFFEYLRSNEVRMQKKPSTAELLNWMLLLKKRCALTDTVEAEKHLFFTSARVSLFKHQKDQEEARNYFEEWSGLKFSEK